MLTDTSRWSHARGNKVVPYRWQATTKHGRVRDYVVNHASDIFKISDIRVALPGISGPTVRLTLEALKREGQIAADGTGRSAVWWKSRSG
jgi:hypothetical protein